jgi:hypothetical protein
VGGEEVFVGWKEETPMTKLLIDNDEEGDEDTGPDRLALAIDRLSDAIDDEMDEVTRLRAINQELVAALKEADRAFAEIANVLRYAIEVGGRDARLHTGDMLAAVLQFAPPIQLALQHAETRTP